MNARRLAQVALLLFVALSVTYFVVSESRKLAAANGPQLPSSTTTDPKTKVIAYYFHGNFRCVSCRKLESLSQQAVMSGFPEKLKQGELRWAAVNVEQAGNDHFISDYRLFSRSLVLVRFKDGKQVEYKNLMKAWELLGDERTLKEYVQSEVRAYLTER